MQANCPSPQTPGGETMSLFHEDCERIINQTPDFEIQYYYQMQCIYGPGTDNIWKDEMIKRGLLKNKMVLQLVPNEVKYEAD